jgi:hypothetical protein
MATPIPPSDHRISLQEAVDIIRRYNASRPQAPTPTLVYHRMAYDRILGQAGCSAIRAYPALHDDGRQTSVLVGVDEAGNDMLGELAQEAKECPPNCSDDSVLYNAR